MKVGEPDRIYETFDLMSCFSIYIPIVRDCFLNLNGTVISI